MEAVFHLSESDSAYGARALRNIDNLLTDETVSSTVTLVANGGGVRHLLASSETGDTVRDLIERGVEVCACSNTIAGAEYGRADLVVDVRVVSSGMAELLRRQDQGYAYIRP